MPRRGRGSMRGAHLRRSGAAPAPPPIEDDNDDEMVDAENDSGQGTPQEDAEDTNDAAQESDQPDDEDLEGTPQPADSTSNKRRASRPLKPWGAPDNGVDEGSESGTPARRGRGRGRPYGGGWRGGFRGRGRGGARGPSHTTRPPTDKDGNTMEVANDEVVLPEDPEGETRVDKNGVLQGDREYRVRTFTLSGRGRRLYMLSTEPARCTGFRDSYLFFTKHPNLYKIIIDDEEKRDLIEREIIPHSYKGRAIGVVTARSVYREFGAKIIVGGRFVVDDYYAAAARERGDVEGELVDPADRLPSGGQIYNRNQYVAWHGASSVYHNNVPNAPSAPARPALITKRRIPMTSANWMFAHAREASNFNSSLRRARQEVNSTGVYDPHTNLICWPANMQPTHARWEQIWDTPSVDDDDHLKAVSHFEPLPGVISRNYLVVDTHLQGSTAAHMVNTTSSYFPSPLPEVSEEDLLELPEECREALLQAEREAESWTSQWIDEAHNTLRARLKPGIGLLGV